MNDYGTQQHQQRLEIYNRCVFANCDLRRPTSETALDGEYTVRRCYYADAAHAEPGHMPLDGEICGLYHHGELMFEWKHMDGKTRMAHIIRHADGNAYFLFDEALYGYSVLDLNTLQCVHYLPSQSYAEGAAFEETFIWFDPFYDARSNLLAVEGCFWAVPYSVTVLDFSRPMQIVTADKWCDLWEICDSETVSSIDFEKWEDDSLVLKTSLWSKRGESTEHLRVSKSELLRRINRLTTEELK